MLTFVTKKAAVEDDGTNQEGQTCLGCNATNTPEWRRGPLGLFYVILAFVVCTNDCCHAGPRTLCNACGLVYAKLVSTIVR